MKDHRYLRLKHTEKIPLNFTANFSSRLLDSLTNGQHLI